MDGLVPEYWDASFSNKKIGTSQMVAGIQVNPFIYPGFVMPTNSTFNTLNNVNQLAAARVMKNFVMVADGAISGTQSSVYTGGGNKVHAISVGGTIQNSGDWPHTINATSGTHNGHTSEEIDDLTLYQLNGVPTLFYSYRDNTDGDLGKYGELGNSPTFSATEDVFSAATGGAVLNKNWEIILSVADNGFMYVGNGNAINRFDGTLSGGATGAVKLNAIDIDVNQKIVAMRDGLSKMWIAAIDGRNNAVTVGINKGYIYIWNKQSTSFNFDDVVPVEGVSKIYDIVFLDNIPYIITQSSTDNRIEIRVYSDGYFTKVIDVGGSTYFPNRNGIFKLLNGFGWVGQNGQVVFYGSVIPGQARGIHNIGSTPAANNTLASSVIGSLNTIFVSYYNSLDSTVSIASWKPLDTTGTADQHSLYTKVEELPKLSRVKGITFFFKPTTNTINANLSTYIYKNFSSDTLNDPGTSTPTELKINYQTDGARGYKYFPLGGENYENFNAIQLAITYPIVYSGGAISLENTLKIYRIQIDYDPTEKIM